MKKLCFLVLALVMAVALFACGGDDGSDSVASRYPSGISAEVDNLELRVGESKSFLVYLEDPNPSDVSSCLDASIHYQLTEQCVTVERDTYFNLVGNTYEVRFTVTAERVGEATLTMSTADDNIFLPIHISVTDAGPVEMELGLGENFFDSRYTTTFTFTAPDNGYLKVCAGSPVHGELMYSYVIGDGEVTSLPYDEEIIIDLDSGDGIRITAEKYGDAEGDAVLLVSWHEFDGGNTGDSDNGGSGDNDNSGGDNGGNESEVNGSIGLDYELSDNGEYYIVIGRGSCTDTELIIPAEYNGLPVGAIGDRAFYEQISEENLHNADITVSVTIPSGVKHIGREAFYYSSTLTTVVVETEGGVFPTVGSSAFMMSKADSYSFRQIESVTFVGDFETLSNGVAWPAVYAMSSEEINAKKVIFDGNIGTIESVHPCVNLVVTGSVDTLKTNAFMGDGFTETVSFGNIRVIEQKAFYRNATIRSFNFNGLESLGVSAFEESGITSAILPGTLTAIPDNAFYKSALTSLTLEDGIISIGSAAFQWCELGYVKFNTTLTSIGSSAFNSSRISGTLNIPANVTYIGSYAFADNQSITSVVMVAPENDKVRVVSSGAFSGCSYINSVSVDGFASYGAEVFANCYSLNNIDFGIIDSINTSVLSGLWNYRAQFESITYKNTSENTKSFKVGNTTGKNLPSSIVDLLSLLCADASSAKVYIRVAPEA